MKTEMRTHTCGELTDKDIEEKVTLCGWVHSRRDHGGVIFLDLRDRYGMTQIVFEPSSEAYKKADKLRKEYVIQVSGLVKKRKPGMENLKLTTGRIEVFADYVDIINKAETPLIEIDDRVIASEELRLKYRYLDLRRPIMQKRLEFRHKAITAAREYLDSKKFIEIETPMLVRATPEGARDYVVPSRVNPGKFYALPQSPQLYKQILMVAGFDRYYQIARCLRDEDLRADRQPEHTQVDLEMSFVSEQDIMDIVEGLYKHVMKACLGIEIKEKFPVLSYQEAMDRYGCDKPDLRFGLELIDVTDIVKDSEFDVFKECIADGGIVKCINPPELKRRELEQLTGYCTELGAKGMAWVKVGDSLEGGIAKHIANMEKELRERVKAEKGTMLLFIADEQKVTNEIMGQLRLKLGDMFYPDRTGFKFCWIVDFPLFEKDEDRWAPAHHIFTMPKNPELLEKEPGKVVGNLFDIVLNGIELASGSIRISNPELQKRVMKVIGMDEKEAEKKFGFLLNAYRYGGPVHGGMGLGFDRFVALMQGFNDIREVIAFPKNKAAQCPMDGSPSAIDEEQMKELGIKSTMVKKKK
jgi:aspartyl-tRNA synthetase